MTAVLRDHSREMGHQIRTKRRCANFNRSRETQGLPLNLGLHMIEIILPAQVTSLVVEIKGQSHVTVQQLRFLQQAFIGAHGKNNIDAFLSVTGALNMIVKELSGKNASLQLAAANCCCNLALGNDKQCELVTKASAPYLILYLQAANMQLVDICAWTIGNLAASGPKAWSILSGQKAGMKLADLLPSTDMDVAHSVIYALTFYVKTGGDDIVISDLQAIAKNAVPLLPTNSSACWLVFLLSCHSACDADLLPADSLIPSALDVLSRPVEHRADLAAVTALLRLLGNACGTEDARGAHALLDCFHQAAPVLWEMLEGPQPHLRREAAWVLANLVNHPGEGVRGRAEGLHIREQLEVKLRQLHGDV